MASVPPHELEEDVVRFYERLEKLNACADAVEWAREYPSLQAAWDACERADWMMWLLGRLSGPPGSPSRKRVVALACKCARTAWKWMPTAARECIRTTEAYLRGEARLDDVREAAYAYAYADAAYAAAAAAYDAAYAADAADAYDAAYDSALRKMADMMRRERPSAPRLR